jgi:DNA processing protein
LTKSELKERLTDAIALLEIPGVGRGRYTLLVKHFGSPSAALAASISDLEAVPKISRTTATAIKESFDGAKARQIAARVVQLGWAALFPGDSEYPVALQQGLEPPPLLFRLGDPFQTDDKMIAIVGTRRCSEPGKRLAQNLAGELAEAGVAVVSGMAEGIDSAAHLGALEAGGRTIAVWGTSLDIVYPKNNRLLAERIVGQGAVYSEYFPGTEPDRAFFPERNRIIAGLSDGVVVVEAGEKSGALITAGYSLDYGRELFAVPGRPGTQKSVGTNQLIKDGACLLTSADDIFRELPRLKGKVAARKFKRLPDMTDTEQRVVSQLSDGPLQIDQLSRAVDLSITDVMQLLLALELKGVGKEISGKRYIISEW